MSETSATIPTDDIVHEEDGKVIIYKTFESKRVNDLLKGLRYAVPQYNTLKDAVKHLGEEELLSIVNSKIASLVVSKIKGWLGTKSDSEKKVLIETKVNATGKDSTVFSISEALAFKPGEREVSMKTQLARLAEMAKDGTLKGAALMAQFQAIMAKGGVTTNLGDADEDEDNDDADADND